MIKIYVTSAFSKNNAGGNKAGVVLYRPELTIEQKMQISKELGFSETAFVNQSDLADYKLEYYTPTEEVPLCGHATIATFATLKLLGLLQKSKCTIETKAGILEMNVSEDGLVMMEQNRPQYYEYLEKRELFSSTNETCICKDAPVQIVSTGLRDIILPVKDMESLDSLKPDFEAMKELSREKDVVGIHAFVKQEPDAGVDAVCRNFAPLYGIDEESATGTASCALAGYLFKHNCKKEVYVFEQGYTMGLPSRITVKVEHDGESIRKIFVGGYGYLVEERERETFVK